MTESQPPISPTLDELISTVEGRTPGDSTLERLGAAVAYSDDLGELADSLVGHFVALARSDGASWAQIGEILGVSKQGAQQRFVPRRPVSAADFENKDLFGRFTARARQVVLDADQHARRLRHGSVGTEHLLLALTADDGIARLALDGLGHDATDIHRRVESRLSPGDVESEGHLPFSPSAKRVLELTLREALKLGHNYIGTEHVVLALVVEGEGIATQVLREVGVDYDRLRAKEIELIEEIVARRRAGG
jgi:Clp amino terminal domain, pathogenicity island component